MITRAEENKYKAVSAILSLTITALIILLLILWVIHVPNPPEISSGSEGSPGADEGVAVTMGTDAQGWGDYKFPKAVNSEPVSSSTPSSNDVLISSQDGVNINEKIEEKKTDTKNENKNNSENKSESKSEPTKPKNKWLTTLNNAKDGSGSGNDPGTKGVEGDPTGKGPNFGSTGGGGTTGNGGGTGGGTGGNKGGFGTGRKTLVMPCRPHSTKHEGKVVVIIKVNRNGDVVEADPNGNGTDTSDPELKLQARQAALCTKFEACTDCPDYSKGTIIFDFGYNNK
ncbi:MAG: hypothetical protein ACK5D5_04905 [Bacteroidota bacterium]|jgi:outer membrane biosynthesis protein TonB